MDQGAATIPGGVGIDADLPELSDLIVDYDRQTLKRRDVMRHAV